MILLRFSGQVILPRPGRALTLLSPLCTIWEISSMISAETQSSWGLKMSFDTWGRGNSASLPCVPAPRVRFWRWRWSLTVCWITWANCGYNSHNSQDSSGFTAWTLTLNICSALRLCLLNKRTLSVTFIRHICSATWASWRTVKRRSTCQFSGNCNCCWSPMYSASRLMDPGRKFRGTLISSLLGSHALTFQPSITGKRNCPRKARAVSHFMAFAHTSRSTGLPWSY